MRQTFFNSLEDHAGKDRSIYLITANLGFKLFDEFRSHFPDRFIDAGVAEQNMISLAAGLSLSGKKVYCYSIIPFLLMRCYEQIRIDVACQDLNVKLVGVGGGFTYGLEGFTHHAVEDLAIMRAMPNMHIVAPADSEEAKLLVPLANDFNRPLYIRLGRTGDPLLHKSTPDFKIGKGMVLSRGKDVAILAIGSMVYQANLAVEMLKKQNISVTLVNMHTLKPLDADLIKDCAASHKLLITVEEHSVIGGLGSAVAEVLSEGPSRCLFKRIGIPEKLSAAIGHTDFLRDHYGLNAGNIVQTILSKLKEL